MIMASCQNAGEKLFIRQGGENVVYDLSKSAARIPCGVSNPKASVTLQKFIKVIRYKPYINHLRYL